MHCPHCDYDNEDLSPDEEGDLVCENCGTVIEDQGGVRSIVYRIQQNIFKQS